MNPIADSGFAQAATYDAHRPSFPAKTVAVLLENLRVAGRQGATVVDLAAGTGKFTELLARQDEQFNVIAVEPQKDMRGVLQEKKLKGVSVKEGLSTSIPLDSGSVDAVVVAQAFHWFADMKSLKEIHRVLQPHGTLGLVWNIEDYNAPRSQKPSTAWAQTMQDYIWAQDDDQPRFRHSKWRQVFDDQIKSSPLALIVAADPLFALPLAEHVEHWEVWLPKERIWDRLTTLSQISILEGDEREKVHKLFLDAVNKPDVDTNDKGEVAVHGATYSYWTSKVPVDGQD